VPPSEMWWTLWVQVLVAASDATEYLAACHHLEPAAELEPEWASQKMRWAAARSEMKWEPEWAPQKQSDTE